MKFKQVAELFEKIEKENSRIEMTKLLAELFTKANEQEISIICNLSLGLLRPSFLGTQFNLAKKNLTKIVAHVLEISVKDVIAKTKKLGDLGQVAAQNNFIDSKNHLKNLSIFEDKSLVNRSQNQMDIFNQKSKETMVHQVFTVNQVYQDLCQIEKASGHGSQEQRAAMALALLQKVDSCSRKFIVRIILGTLRLGFSDMTLVDALSWMVAHNKSLRPLIEHAYNICADIGLIASTLKVAGIESLKKMSIHIGIPILPAAAERMATAQAIFEKLGNCVAQPKLDGFRIQIHINKIGKQASINFFSRNLIDMSSMFPDLVKVLLKLPVDSIICDSEAIAYDPNTGLFLPFQETVKRKRKHGIEQAIVDFPLRIFLFDLLYLNGRSFLNVGHESRRNALLEVLKNFKDDMVTVIDEKKITSIKELQDYFVFQIDSGLEGLVVKKPNAPYQPGKRNFNWIKYKHQHEGQLEDALDCVILGYYAGSGKRATFGVGAFLVGLFNKNEDRFETVAKIGTGLFDKEWKELKTKCDAIKIAQQPKNVVCVKELYPDVWCNPEIVCLIRADEITLSPRHSAGRTKDNLGYALRFPRFMGYRPDKGLEETTTIDELKALYANQFKK